MKTNETLNRIICEKCHSDNLVLPNDGYIYCKECGHKTTILETLTQILSPKKECSHGIKNN